MRLPHLPVRTLLAATCKLCHQGSRRQLSQAVNGDVFGKCPTASAHRLLRPLLTDLPASANGSERLALVDVDPISKDRWFSHSHVPIAVFKNLQLLRVLLHFKFSRFLDHLRVQRQSSASVSELLITVVDKRATATRAPPESSSLHCCDCQLSISSPSFL